MKMRKAVIGVRQDRFVGANASQSSLTACFRLSTVQSGPMSWREFINDTGRFFLFSGLTALAMPWWPKQEGIL